MKKILFVIAGCVIGAALTASVFVFCRKNVCKSSEEIREVTLVAEKPTEITGFGYIRGSSQYALKNKYASFVSKVHIYAYNRVKKGDCILEYDDYDLRVKITEKENSIASLKQEIDLQETKLKLVNLDPLPSDYRNINWKTTRAKELLERTENEWMVYRRLFRNKSVSDLDMRSKKQAYLDASAAYQITVSDQEKVNSGLKKLYLLQAEQQLALLKTKLAGLERELELLNEQRQYYKIIAPYDGLIKTHSDTVGAWNAAATEAACLHKEAHYKLYAYFAEEDIPYIKDGMTAKFFSHDSGKWYEAKAFELTRTRTAVGDGIFHLVKFRVTSDISKDIRCGKNGSIRIEGAVTVKFEI